MPLYRGQWRRGGGGSVDAHSEGAGGLGWYPHDLWVAGVHVGGGVDGGVVDGACHRAGRYAFKEGEFEGACDLFTGGVGQGVPEVAGGGTPRCSRGCACTGVVSGEVVVHFWLLFSGRDVVNEAGLFTALLLVKSR